MQVVQANHIHARTRQTQSTFHVQTQTSGLQENMIFRGNLKTHGSTTIFQQHSRPAHFNGAHSLTLKSRQRRGAATCASSEGASSSSSWDSYYSSVFSTQGSKQPASRRRRSGMRPDESVQQQQQQQQQQQDHEQAQRTDAAIAAGEAGTKKTSEAQVEGRRRRARSSWDAKEAGGGRTDNADYLYELGKAQQYNINVDHGQNSANLDYLFTGNILGHKSDIADGSLRKYEVRHYNNIVGDYYIAPQFMEKVAMHMVKNFFMDQGVLDSKSRVPLILGIWGGKGMGKTFQTELAFKKMGVKPIIMSAGELEHEWAGTPGRLIRERYRRAAEVQKVWGTMSCLMINDLDAGIGHFGNTQVTVNNQIVVGTLMNLCDNPNQVSVGQEWRADERIARIPIIVTGNDFSTLFAPLIRDGRMEKFYWKPAFDDLVSILHQMYKDDGLSSGEMATLLKRFPNQPLDFFGALRASTYDNQIRDWIVKDVVGQDFLDEDANMSDLNRRLLKKDGLPVFEPVQLTLEMLIKEGERLEMEQEMVNRHKLSQEYLKMQKKIGPSMIGLKG